VRCPKCGGYSIDNDGRCLDCGHIDSTDARPPGWWSSKDWGTPQKPSVKGKEQSANKYSPKLTICPNCHERSLFYIDKDVVYECLNLKCKRVFTKEELRIIDSGVLLEESKGETSAKDSEHFPGAKDPDNTQSIHHSELSNPLLLTVKMFLADIRSWRRQYKEGEYVCADFAQEVYDAATERGIRCGYAVVEFEKSEVGHAIVAFETDYALIFIEPQDGEQVEILINRPYPTHLEGVPERDNVKLIDISWNDGTSSRVSGDD
jgi:hypothetical protein